MAKVNKYNLEGLTDVFAGIWPTRVVSDAVFGLDTGESRLSEGQLKRINATLMLSVESGIEFAQEHWGISNPYAMDPIELRKAIDAAEAKQKLG